MVYFKMDDYKPMLLSADDIIFYLQSKHLIAGFTCHFNELSRSLYLTCDVNIHMCCKFRDEYAKIMAYLGDVIDIYSGMTIMTNQPVVSLLDIASKIYSEYPQVSFFINYDYLGMLNVYTELKHIDELDRFKCYLDQFNGTQSDRGRIKESGGECDVEEISKSAYQDIRKFVEDTYEPVQRIEAHILTPKIKNIYANKEKRTIVIKWETNETTKVTCDPSDEWDLEKGIMAAITRYVLGNNYNAYTILEKYIKSVKGDK